MNFLKRILKQIYGWFFPNLCLFCSEYTNPEEFACKKCMPDRLIERNFNLKIGQQQKFLYCFSLDNYEGEIQKYVENFKYKGKKAYARKYAFLLKSLMSEEDLSLFHSVCYVPMTAKKEKRRGYNQAKILAKEFSKISGIPLCDLLLKVKENRTQHTLKYDERIKNIKAVYTCKLDINGQNILLIDDIITTGATICECAKELYRAGALNVKALSIASTEFKS